MAVNATVKLYDEDAYATSFEGKVVAVSVVGKNKQDTVELEGRVQLDIVLDRTLFFPEEGGQNSDKGTITIDESTYKIVHVRLEQTTNGDVLHHITEAGENAITPDELIGRTASGQIDWQDRFDKMQNHSGEHILSGVIHNQFGYDNVGFHLNNDVFTMDFNGTFTKEQIAEIEAAANRIVYENVSIDGKYYTKEELQAMVYRSKKDFDVAVRIVTVGDYDACACCAPHVRSTGEIGLIKIIKAESWKGGTRFTVLCGKRAYKDYVRKQQLLQSLSAQFSTSEDKLADIIDGMKKSLAKAEYELSLHQTEALYMELVRCAESNESNVTIVFTDIANAGAIRTAVDRAMTAQPEHIFGVMSGDDTVGYRYLIGSRDIDVKGTMTERITALGGKGGGNQDMIQGMLKATKEEIVHQMSK